MWFLGPTSAIVGLPGAELQYATSAQAILEPADHKKPCVRLGQDLLGSSWLRLYNVLSFQALGPVSI